MTDKAIAAAIEAWFADPTMRKSDLMQDRMRAAIAAYQAVVGEGWQPIESAPRDGTLILAADCNAADQNYDVTVIRADDLAIKTLFWVAKLTHWMPITAPPKEIAKNVP